MRITIPEKLTPLNAINFVQSMEGCTDEEEFIYDFQQMQHCRPYGLLLTAYAIRNNIKRFPDSTHKLENPTNTQGGRFAASFGFYQSIGFDEGLAKEEEDIGYRYIPIKKISANDLHQEYTDTTLLNEKVNRQAATFSDMLVADQPQKVREAIQYCFREIIRNTFEHGKTDSFWVCGQYWPTRNEAEIAILDEGIGILQSLLPNSRITVNTCAEANTLALQPGLSRTIGIKQDPEDIWQNSGYGLYVASTLCAINGGQFWLCSGTSAILVNADGQTEYNAKQEGTAICLNIRTDSKKLRHFDHTLEAIVKEGEKKAFENGEKRILTASKITTIASMIRHIENSVQTYAPNEADSNSPIPLNTVVQFSAKSISARGDIIGTFEYDGKTFDGVLLNVTGFNRTKYVENQMTITAVVRKIKKGKYNLLEKHSYDKKIKQ